MTEVLRLRAEYAELHREVLDLSRDEMRNRVALDRLQLREQEIVDALRKLGASVYPGEARAH
ncbi:hypothetical protein [Bradyrhizobium sp. SEMIA]|uniref:hypothetical protein n=1 Tax=Bradyrhizobium sp. SEMIA TaxID=2597515 RepID=UPI0018A607C9|nr:hypothetical protein [Bradyrhizobium sp. SEMIA]QOG20420.1 hypothetical protein FOM02_26790 [Bradyrhizobium sp. SEMIA]